MLSNVSLALVFSAVRLRSDHPRHVLKPSVNRVLVCDLVKHRQDVFIDRVFKALL